LTSVFARLGLLLDLGAGFTFSGEAVFFAAANLGAEALGRDLLAAERELDFFDAETSLLDNEYLDIGEWKQIKL